MRPILSFKKTNFLGGTIYIDCCKAKLIKCIIKFVFNLRIKVIAGNFQNKAGPAKGYVNPIYLDVELEKDKNFIYTIPSSHNVFIYLVSGEVKIGNKDHNKLENSTLISLKNGDELKITAVYKSKFLVIAGKPIGEPVARGGPFVMNTKQEILKAVQDYHSGNFVQK